MEVEHLAVTLNELSEIIRGQRHWDEVRKDLLEECRKLFDAEVCALFRVRNDYVEIEDHIGYTRSDGTEIPLLQLRNNLRYKVGRLDDGTADAPRYDGITGQVATTGVEYFFNDTLDPAPSWRGKPWDLGIWSDARPFRCMVAVPLKIGSDVIGVLKVENKKRPEGKRAYFDDIDRAVLRALGNLFSIASKFSYFRGLPYQELVDTTLTWLEQFDRQNLYHKMVEFCSRIFHADVCALYVRADKKDVQPRMALVAGRLRDGDAMDPTMLSRDGGDPTYLIGRLPDGTYDGITGEIATVGQPAKIDKYEDIGRPPDKIGKWDTIVWDGDPAANFLCMIGVPLTVNGRTEPIGILKVERTKSNSHGIFHDEDLDILSQVADGFAVHVHEVLTSGTKLIPGREHEYRITRAQQGKFIYKSLGGIRIRHLMTSICQSDLDYFNHRKDDRKLDERLPMPLGHETVGEVLHANPDAQDVNGKKIRAGDRVFVIPLIPCGSCSVCENQENSYGENYCQSSRFMASNAPGSLRSSYDYDAGLTIRIEDDLKSNLAVFAEPMANVVQLLDELGFNKNAIELNMRPFEKQDFTFFRVQGQQFSNIFNTIIDQEPNLRTLYVLSGALTSDTVRSISQQGIMRKGLALLGRRKLASETVNYIRSLEKPHVLILGNGVSAYLLAVVLTQAYAIPAERIVVTGRTQAKLDQFSRFAAFRFNVRDVPVDTIISNLTSAVGRPERYDIVFEMAGGHAIEKNVDIALKVLKERGILAMFGLTDRPINVDFAKIIETEVYVKGSYRASLKAYSRALRYITEYKPIQEALSCIIDDETEINGHRSMVHDIHSQEHLTELFRAANRPREKLGRLIVGRFIHESA